MDNKKSKKLGQILEESGYEKIYLDLTKDNFVLVRENDNKQVTGSVVKYVEWNEDGTFKSVHDEIGVGRSAVIDPAPHGQFRWMTTKITEIISESKFRTKNSTYNLYKV